ncbi:hypothetical protein [Methylophaga sp. OBS3]|uniref:hypothetical protein n=1 Tax=Methylophaga sp. OBS3 TaxID=2991934 RepID=UPI0022500623|nr:hypothetical protein [Methylophaga sp. OBS3]MCX4188855.1 hypothetical protein [Methylophaga sp. OBS3]
MDPVSMLFSSFLNAMTTSTHNHISDVMGVELQAKVVEYQDHNIDYQYQLWKIKPESVCISKKTELINEYSSCTNAAKAMFTDTCQYLNQHPQNHWKYTKLKNMYCTAAVSYAPITATITRPSEAETEVWEAKQKCSLLTLEARQTTNPSIEKKRKVACDHAKAVAEK